MHAAEGLDLPGNAPDPAWTQAVDAARRRAVDPGARAAVDLAVRQGIVITRAQARDCGMDDAAMRRLVARRQWSVPRRGVLCPLPPAPIASIASIAAADDRDGLPGDPTRAPYGLAVQVRATAAALTHPLTVVSHESSAAIIDLPILDRTHRPTLSIVDADRLVSRGDVLVRCVGIRDAEVQTWFGARHTNPARTVIDLARSAGVAGGLIAADAALGCGLVTIEDLDSAREHARYRPGVRTCDRVLELVDGRAESPLESLVRLCLIGGELPVPDLQVWIDTRRGPFRVDMLYREQRVVVEADGELKYDGRRPGALVEEKRRQEALEQAGYAVVRVTWWEVRAEPWEVVDRVRRKLTGRR